MTGLAISWARLSMRDRRGFRRRSGGLGDLLSRAVRLGATIAALAAGASGARAGVLFLDNSITADSYASAAADGAAYGFGDEGRGHTFSDARSNSIAFSATDGANGGFAVAQGVATGRFAGFAMNLTSAAGAPLPGQEPGSGATVATETETFESVTAFASDFQSLTSQFAGADRATSRSRLKRRRLTRKRSSPGSPRRRPRSPAFPRPLPSRRGPARSRNPGVAMSGEASAEAFSHTAFDYTFEIIGDRPETIAIRYGGKGDAPSATKSNSMTRSARRSEPTGSTGAERGGDLDDRFARRLFAAYRRLFGRQRHRRSVRGRERLRGRLVARRVRHEESQPFPSCKPGR